MISFAKIVSDTFLLAWNVSSAVTFLLPLFAFSVARLTSESEEDYNDNQNNNENNYYDNNYQNPNNYDQYGNYVGPTHWWQFWKRNNNGQYEQEENSGDEYGAPWWYIWGEREGDEREEEGNGAVVFVYLWTLVFFAGLVYVGNTTEMTINRIQALRWALLGFANYCFVTIVLLVGLEGAIETDGREIEEDGFYGQRAVLLFITCLFALVQSIVFVYWTTKRLKHLRAAALTESSDEYVNVEYEEKNPTTIHDYNYKITI